MSGVCPSALPDHDETRGWAPWWTTRYGAWRRQREIDAMNGSFPSFRLEDEGAGLFWSGSIRSSMTGRNYRVRVQYPYNFPDTAPIVVIESHQFPAGMPHLLNGNQPCLFTPSQGTHHGYDPARTTAATLVSWTALWIHAYETWCETGEWPGRGV